MLTADLVTVRRRGNELHIPKLTDATRATAARLATELSTVYRQGVGSSREDVDRAVADVPVDARAEKLKGALVKLLEDRCVWGAETTLDPAALRDETFRAAARQRAALSAGERFDRGAVLAEVAARLELDAEALERSLYADLRNANLLVSFDDIDESTLITAYEKGQLQAVLLRAVRVRIGLRQTNVSAARAIFRRLKFLGLLHTIVPLPGGYDIVVDGPLSLFESVTKYGVRMAQLVPLLEACPVWTLEADLRWGKERLPLTFRAEGATSNGKELDEPADQPEEILALRRAFAQAPGGWWASRCNVVIELPGIGLCIPDLLFRRGKTKIYFEALGYWSREAVFRRVDLVEQGIAEKVLFAVSSRLRVSEEVLDERASSALYVYKGTMSARAIAERLELLAAR